MDEPLDEEYARRFQAQFIPKYRDGMKEHETVADKGRGILRQVSVEHAKGEILDLWAYVNAIGDVVEECLEALDEIKDKNLASYVDAVALENKLERLTALEKK